jgi:hypothetical protein
MPAQNGSSYEPVVMDQHLGKHGESILPQLLQGRGRHRMETPVSRWRDVQDTHALRCGLAGFFHLEGQHLLAQQLVEGLPEEVIQSEVQVNPHRQRVERSRLADVERRPIPPLPRVLQPGVSRIQGGFQRDNTGHDDRARVDRDQGQPCLARIHQDEPQRICGHRVCRGWLPRGGTHCTSWPGWPNRYIYAMGKRNDPVVTGQQ